MNITSQTNENECGVCVIKSLVDYLHHKNVKYDDLLNQAKITNDGLSIYELEILAEKFGLQLESYQCTIDELFSVNKKDYFIILINNDDKNHYVIAKIISKDVIQIYCSINGIYELHKDDFLKNWNNIYIKVSKSKIKLRISNEKTIDWNLINWKYLLLVNMINIFIILVSFVGSLFLKKVIDLIINDQQLNNLLMIVITFLVAYLLEIALHYFLSLFNFKINYRFYEYLHKKTYYILDYKYLDFFKKVDEGYIVNLNQYLYEFSFFYNIRLNQIIADCLIVLFVNIILIFINYNFLLICLLFSILIIALNIIKTRINKRVLLNVESDQAKYNFQVIGLLKFIKNNRNFKSTKKYLNNINEFLYKNKSNAEKLLINSSTINLFEEIFYVLYYVLNVIVATVLIVNNKIALSSLMFVISLMQMYYKSIKNLSTIYYDFETFKITKKIILDIWNIENIKQYNGLALSNFIELRYKNHILENDSLIIGPNGIGKSTMLKTFAQLIKNDNKAYINSLNLELYDSSQIKTKILYLSDEYIFNEDDILDLFKGQYCEVASSVMKMLNIDSLKESQLSLGQIQILNFLSLLNYENKIICLDEFLNHVDHYWKDYLLSEIKPLINKNNFLLMVDHDLNQQNNYFKNYVTIDEKLF